ncbi:MULTISPECIES: hypothetical protein [Ralstonia]|jgi:hypothetical protein|uniref:Uncharacterized protein n=1 Tax=Ralstonia pickettii TaxID=329 RepID=A0A7X2HK52_RALPI|nr:MULTISPECIES: hypothetical protein [Ralstonia]AJW43457.1 signal peptide protein [Ralstonia mannitolilytica]AJW47373.1 signal peptide protein [Ralstonia mannitolilytica]MRS98002.1 hypothetical protein [Ralstonia pickettii]QIF09736.1 hypothetical protein G5A69_19600 [Ralstonia mannitolilytica]CAJ0729539.1 hypothetical protein R76706_02069 [Ralstonia mannitolilytica]
MKTTSQIAIAGILLFVSAMPALAAGSNALLNSVLENARTQGPRDPYTDGGRIQSRDPYTDGQSITQRDVYTDGASSAQRDVYTSGL